MSESEPERYEPERAAYALAAIAPNLVAEGHISRAAWCYAAVAQIDALARERDVLAATVGRLEAELKACNDIAADQGHTLFALEGELRCELFPDRNGASIVELVREAVVMATAERWVPVAERLPESKVRVIGAHADGVTESHWDDALQQWVVAWIGPASPVVLRGVTHWRPMPQPPAARAASK